MPSWAKALIRLAVALLGWWQERKARTRVDAARADPGTEWMRKFGGTDQRGQRNKRTPPGSPNSGGSSD